MSAHLPLPRQRVGFQFGKVGTVYCLGAVCFVLTIIQMLLGGDTVPAVMLSGATFFGLMSVVAAGGATAIGLLNLILVGRVLLGAYVAKNLLLGQPVTTNLLAPESTAAVMLLGFFAVWAATVLTRSTVRTLSIFDKYTDVVHLRSILYVMLFASVISSIAVRFSTGDGEYLTGGIWGIAKSLNAVRNLSLPIFMLYLWRRQTHRWLTHPALLLLLTLLFFIGVLSNSKLSMAEPIAFYILMAIARYGWRHPVGWVVVPIGLLIFQFFIYPISQYARNAGGTYKDPVVAATATLDIVASYVVDPSFREFVQRNATTGGHWDDGTSYLPQKLVAAGRFALVGEADRLVSASNVYAYTGWETIANSLLIAVPHFLYPGKPQNGSGNYLARYTGDLGPEDVTTPVSYGFMANAYNAFGIWWVLPLSFATALLVITPLMLISRGPVYANPWSMFCVVSLHQTYAESSFSGLFGAFNVPILASFVLIVVLIVEWTYAHRSKSSASARRPTAGSELSTAVEPR